jgi:hypothetical protein
MERWADGKTDEAVSNRGERARRSPADEQAAQERDGYRSRSSPLSSLFFLPQRTSSYSLVIVRPAICANASSLASPGRGLGAGVGGLTAIESWRGAGVGRIAVELMLDGVLGVEGVVLLLLLSDVDWG